jgi:hypothetical protein
MREGKKIRFRDPDPRSFFRELRKSLGLKMPNFLDADLNTESGIFLILDPGWKNSDHDRNIQLNFSISM